MSLSKPWSVREMTESDLPRVLEIEALSFRHPWNRDGFMGELDRGPVTRARVLLEEDAVRGYVLAWLVADELHISNLAVHPDTRKRGGGRFLLSRLFEEAMREGALWCFLEVRESNLEAIALYAGLGFQAVGKRSRYYPDGEDALVLAKDLGASAPPVF